METVGEIEIETEALGVGEIYINVGISDEMLRSNSLCKLILERRSSFNSRIFFFSISIIRNSFDISLFVGSGHDRPFVIRRLINFIVFPNFPFVIVLTIK